MQLNKIVAAESAKLKEVINKVNFSDPKDYANYLAQSYYYVSHSVKLLALAVAKFKKEDKKLEQRFIKHISEENNHEVIIERDLKALGFTIEDFPENPETQMFWEPQYTKIESSDPAELLGYILMLEHTAVHLGKDLLAKAKVHGKGLKFLEVHVEEDVEHVEEAVKAISSLDDVRLKKVTNNLIQSYRSYSQLLLALNEERIAA